jgi:hypothetical protein
MIVSSDFLMIYPRHCEEHRDEAIQLSVGGEDGLLRCARNDGLNFQA